jgi:hypothetical protein
MNDALMSDVFGLLSDVDDTSDDVVAPTIPPVDVEEDGLPVTPLAEPAEPEDDPDAIGEEKEEEFDDLGE